MTYTDILAAMSVAFTIMAMYGTGYILFRFTKPFMEYKKGAVLSGVLSDVWVTSSFSFCFTEPIWRLVANPGNMRIPKVQKEPYQGLLILLSC